MGTLRARTAHWMNWASKRFKTDMHYIVHAGFWGNLNALAITLFSFGLYVVYAHVLSKETYGTYQYLLSFFSIATAFTLTGMNSAVVRAVAKGYEGTLAASIRVQLQYGLIPLFGALGFALYYFLQGNTLLAIGLVIIGTGTPLLYAYNTYGSFLVGKKDFRRNTTYGISSNAVYYSALAATAWFSHSPLFLLGVNLFIQAILYFIFYRITVRVYKPNDTVDQESLSYGLHLSAMGAFGSVAGQLGNIFIFHFLGPAQLALYSFASAAPERLGNICFKFLAGAALTRFSERSVEEIREHLLHKMLLTMGAGAVIAGIYVLFCSWFFHLFFPAYVNAIPYSMAISIGLIFGAPAYLPTTALTALKRTRELYILNIVNPIAQIVFPLVGVAYGLWGYLISHVLLVIFSLIFTTSLVYYSGE